MSAMPSKSTSASAANNRTHKPVLSVLKAEHFQLLVDTIRDYAIILLDVDGTVVSWNPGAEAIYGFRPSEIVGQPFNKLYPPEAVARQLPQQELQQATTDGRLEIESLCPRKGGAEFWGNVTLTPLLEDGGLIGFARITRDLTESRASERATRIRDMAQAILDVSVPVVQVWAGVLAAPLIGTLDSQRTQLFMQTLLQSIVDTRSEMALVDITGVPVIDTQTAAHLLETFAAVELLGARVILTGVSPSIAQTLVHLGIGMGNVITRPSFAAGLAIAFESLHLDVVSVSKMWRDVPSMQMPNREDSPRMEAFGR